MVLTVSFVLPGDRALLPPSPCGLKVLSSPVEPNEPPQDLTPASRRQDHTTSPSASSAVVLHAANRSRRAIRPALASHAQHCCVHRIPPRVRDDRDTPLVWDETAAVIEVIWVGAEQENFLLWDSTAPTTPNLARRAVDFFYAMSFVIATENKNLARRANHRHERMRQMLRAPRFRRLKGRSEGGEVQKTQPICPSGNGFRKLGRSRTALFPSTEFYLKPGLLPSLVRRTSMSVIQPITDSTRTRSNVAVVPRTDVLSHRLSCYRPKDIFKIRRSQWSTI